MGPLVAQVLSRIAHALPGLPVVVLTSEAESDDPLVSYLERCGVDVFRGPLEDVFERFRQALDRFPGEWVLRLSADSPLLDARVLRAVVGQSAAIDADLVTTISPRTFPRGHNAELIRASALRRIDASTLTEDDREHVTPVFYRQPERFRIVNIASGHPELAQQSLAVDTLDDLRRLEQAGEDDLWLPYDSLLATPG